MNTYVTLCLFAIFLTNVHSKPSNQQLISKINYIVEPNGIFVEFDLEIIRLKVKNVIWDIESTIQQLEQIHIAVEEDTHMAVMQKWWDQMDKYRDYINLLLAAMWREVNAAKIKNKDAQYCYDTNFCAIKQHGDTAYEAATKCEESAENSIKKDLEYVNSHVSFGKTLVTELDNLFLNCHDSDSIKMQSCILSELETINSVVKNFKENASHVKLNTLPVSDSIILQANKCLNNAYLLARFESEGAMLSNSRCVQNVLENKKNIIKKLTPTCESQITSI